jgi:hypothetical protein
MSELNRNKFNDYWKSTEVIREYRRMLFTFGDIELPYVLVAEHSKFKDRAFVIRGLVLMQKPQIVLPSYYSGLEFKDGFEHAKSINPDALYLLRTMSMPYSQIKNKPITQEQIEYGSVQSILDKFDKMMENQDDTETGLIKGNYEGADIALMRYSFGLAVKSAPGNVNEFFEHIRRKRGDPISPNERITDEDIKRLFG